MTENTKKNEANEEVIETKTGEVLIESTHEDNKVLPDDVVSETTVVATSETAIIESDVDHSNSADTDSEQTQLIKELEAAKLASEKEEAKQGKTKKVTIKKHLERPMSRKEKKKRRLNQVRHEKAFDHRMHHDKKMKSFKMNFLIGSAIAVILLFGFKYLLNIDLSSILEQFMTVSLFVSGGLLLISMVVLLTDRSNAIGSADPITDFFIINKGRVMGSTKKRHLDRINTRFMMVTLLKLYQKEQIAILDEKIIYGTMDGKLTKDETALLNFMLDHNITNVNEFIETVSKKDHHPIPRKDHLYANYKESIVEMANEKNYINNSINKAKLILLGGAVAFAVIALMLLSKGEGTILMLGVYGLQAVALYLMSNLIYANSRGAHQRIKQLKKQKRVILSPKTEVYTSLIYNYLFGKEEKVLRRIHKQFETHQISDREYRKFSETYNGFNYILDFIKYEM